jgi:hypothetical protein
LERRIRLLYVDIDGTLIRDSDIVSPRTLDAIARARSRGCVTVVCTGRTRHTARVIAGQLGHEGYAAYLNGAVIWDEHAPRLLHKVRMDPDAFREAVRVCRKHEAGPFCFAVEDDDKWVHADRVCPVDPQFVAVYPDRMVWVGDVVEDLPNRPVSIEVYTTRETADAIIRDWRAALGEGVTTYLWHSYTFRSWGVHLHAGDVDKSVGAQWIARRLEVDPRECMAIGDEVNDLQLLRWAGIGVAMGNAHADCLACADHVTGHCHEDGVAQAIERFILSD